MAIILAGCVSFRGPVVSTSPPIVTATNNPTTPTPTPIITMTVTPEITPAPIPKPTPTPTPDPKTFDPNHPFRFGDQINYIEFQNSTYTGMTTDFGGSWIKPSLYTGGEVLDDLQPCTHEASVANVNDGQSLGPVNHKWELLIHSGIASCGMANPANFLRIFLEGQSWWFPNLANRETQMEALTGKQICFTQETRKVCFEIVEVVLVTTQKWFAECDPLKNSAEYDACLTLMAGRLERFFPKTGYQSGVHEIFMVFCSSEFVDDEHPKFILRLQPITDESKP